jgi:hypothetical protein
MESASNTQRAHLALFMFHLVLASVLVWGFGAGKATPWLVILGLMGTSHIAIAIGSASQQEWARIGSLCWGCVLLIGFPIGTMVGIYLIANAKSDWSQERPRYSGSLTDGWPVRGEIERA